MNYYERHIGDYLKDTSHLSLLEHGIYTRLLDVYYTREGAIPDDQVARLIGARSRDEREALQAVLAEFFQRTADGWVQTRCEREIARFKDGEPEREAKKANEDNRLKRHREERARLFKVLTDAGQHAPWNIGMNELRELVKRVTATAPETAPETQLPPLPATAPATPATATQTPLPNTHTQEKTGRVVDPRPDPSPPAPAPTRLGTRLPADWTLPDDWRQWCVENRPDLSPEITADRFRDFWVAKPGKDGRKADWQATWRNWCRSEKPGPAAAAAAQPPKHFAGAI